MKGYFQATAAGNTHARGRKTHAKISVTGSSNQPMATKSAMAPRRIRIQKPAMTRSACTVFFWIARPMVSSSWRSQCDVGSSDLSPACSSADSPAQRPPARPLSGHVLYQMRPSFSTPTRIGTAESRCAPGGTGIRNSPPKVMIVS